MRRMVLWLTALATALSLCACRSGGEDLTVYDVDYGGGTYTVDTEGGTITTPAGDVCRFEMSGTRLRITYPDGSTYWWEERGNVGSGGWSDDYDPGRYVPGDTLWEVLGGGDSPDRERAGNPLLAIFLLIVGGFYVASPRVAWQMSHGWRYKNVEPSDMALEVNRLLGVAFLVIGVACFFLG